MNLPIAIVGGGISGLAVAFELARHGLPFTLFEASGRLGGIVETVRRQGFVIECGPDSWVTEKPWARELAIELGLEDQILLSNDDRRRTYLVRGSLAKDSLGSRHLVPIPEGMRMMAPVRWGPILKSPLLSWRARLAYLREPGRARELKAAASRGQDESVAEFVRRHFGEEATATLAGPLLAGVFGGAIETLSVRAVMPAFVKMEAEQGSLITALRRQARASVQPQPALFSTLATGLESLIERLAARLPESSIRLNQPLRALSWDDHAEGQAWRLSTPEGEHRFGSIVLATPAHVTRDLLGSAGGSGARIADLLPRDASSSIIVALAFEAAEAARMRIPRGFGFLVPPSFGERNLLACTFVDQKFSRRAPPGAVLLRAFFGGRAASSLAAESDEALVRLARQQLAAVLEQQDSLSGDRQNPGAAVVPAATPVLTVVRRWPLSLPQYEVGHLERVRELESLARAWAGLYLAGNAYHGVGLPDLIREARATARAILEKLHSV